MKRTGHLALPVIGLIGLTRGMLGAGLGLLLADRLDPARRARIARILLAVGAASTIPLAVTVLRSRRPSPRSIDRGM